MRARGNVAIVADLAVNSIGHRETERREISQEREKQKKKKNETKNPSNKRENREEPRRAQPRWMRVAVTLTVLLSSRYRHMVAIASVRPRSAALGSRSRGLHGRKSSAAHRGGATREEGITQEAGGKILKGMTSLESRCPRLETAARLNAMTEGLSLESIGDFARRVLHIHRVEKGASRVFSATGPAAFSLHPPAGVCDRRQWNE